MLFHFFDYPSLIPVLILVYNITMSDITYIGITNYQNKHLRFGIKEQDRSGHIYSIGKTGVGKSTLLLNMAISDIKNGKGVGIIDPHGDLAEAILDHIPKERIRDVIYFNPADTECPISFNPLSMVDATQQHIVASNLIATFKKMWADSWGPRLEHIFRNAVLSLLQYPQATLLDIQPLLTNADFRNEVIHHITDTALRTFWLTEFNPLSVQMKHEVVSPIVNKIGLFQTNPLIKNIVGGAASSFNMASVLNEQKIFIANLSKGILGEDGTQLLGSMLVTQFQTAALARTIQAEDTRFPFYLYIDEMHSFVTLSFGDMLSESRKYGLCLFLTHQYMYQLQEDIRNAILGNAGTVISFRVGAPDARLLEEEFSPVISMEDLMNLPQYHMYIKLLIDGTTSRPFSAITTPLPAVERSYKQEIIQACRNTAAQQRDSKSPKIVPTQKVPGSVATLFDM